SGSSPAQPTGEARRTAAAAQISHAVAVAGQDYLPGVAALGNMMGNVGHDNASEAGHGRKVSEGTGLVGPALRDFGGKTYSYSRSGRKQWGQSRLSPVYFPPGLFPPGLFPVCPRFISIKCAPDRPLQPILSGRL